ncbi:hypothetical protein GCM10010394_08860 [Streptomyces crystallinus]|uniref:Uncharacterized protein n=1 Tax=Streptomyces crystallinus TaxID=68191 RepID=A0ABN1F4U6_9ACTN
MRWRALDLRVAAGPRPEGEDPGVVPWARVTDVTSHGGRGAASGGEGRGPGPGRRASDGIPGHSLMDVGRHTRATTEWTPR